MKNKIVALLIGGVGEQRDISLNSQDYICESLAPVVNKIKLIDFNPKTIIKDIESAKPDIVYNGLDGIYGEDGRIQGLLDIMEIPYTHSGVMACAISENKFISKKICQSSGIKCPQGFLINKQMISKNRRLYEDTTPFTFIIKASVGGASNRLKLIRGSSIANIKLDEFKETENFIIEQYVQGREFTVAVMDNKSIGIAEIITVKEVFDKQTKYDGNVRYEFQPNIDKGKKQEIEEVAVKAHKIIGCRGITRTDLIMSSEGDIYFLELNINPGFTRSSIFPKIAIENGISNVDIVEFLLSDARYGLSDSVPLLTQEVLI